MFTDKKYHFLFFSLLMFCVFIPSVIAQKAMNQYDTNGKRQGVWKKMYNNGNLRYTGRFEHGKEVGEFKFYALTGEKNPIAIKKYEKNNDTVKVSFFTKSGKLESKGSLLDKKRVGLWTYYFPDGKTILSTEHYQNGQLEGVSITYYKSGKITEKTNYKAGKLHGLQERFTDTGLPISSITYKEGIADGPAVFYDRKGKILAEGSYQAGIKKGVWLVHQKGEIHRYDGSMVPQSLVE